jgi:hypothetical protein
MIFDLLLDLLLEGSVSVHTDILLRQILNKRCITQRSIYSSTNAMALDNLPNIT